MSIEKIMEQAQVFASAWSVVGGPFDGGDAVEVATQEKDELRCMVAELVEERDALAAKLKEVDGRIDDLLATCHRLALELECLLLDTKDSAPVSRWWDSAMAALDEWHKVKDSVSAELDGQEPVARVCDWQAPEGLLKGWVETNYDEASECANKVRHRD